MKIEAVAVDRPAFEGEGAGGQSRDEVVAAKPTAPWDERWGGGFIGPDEMAGTVYDSLIAGE